MKSIMKHQFGHVPGPSIQRSSFDRSHGLKTTLDEAGKLYPIYVDEALPGDTFKMNMAGFARLATPIFPLMDNMQMDTHFFAVPYRLIWDNWKKFMGEQVDPGDSIDYLIPSRTTSTTVQSGSDADYLGLPTKVAMGGFSVLPFRAIAKIWNEWFRDQNLQDTLPVVTNDTENIATGYSPFTAGAQLPRGKRHDYFTSCLPWPQKGDPVSLPLGTQASVVGDGTRPYVNDGSSSYFLLGGTNNSDGVYPVGTQYQLSSGNAYWDKAVPDGSTGLYADLTTATAATINDLLQAMAIQKLLVNDARGGTRYIEIIKSHFGVTSSDGRLQRPEYLGGGSTNVNINPIAQTSESGTSPQGNLAGIGTAAFKGHGFSKSFEEHCILIGFVSIRADLTYQQGLDRMWSRQTRYDFYWPELANIGEQEVLNKEIYVQGTSVDDDVFGYQERHAEYRYKASRITGKMRSNATGSLDAWHLSQEFGSLPGLNSTFIEENPPLDRVVAVPSEPKFIFDAYFNLRCARPMPTYSVPGFGMRF